MTLISLCTFDHYLEGCIERTPDIYLIELKEELCEARGLDVATATIHRTLGFTQKKVNML